MPVFLVYTASCELQGQLLRNQSTITLNPNESSEAAQMITLCSTNNSRHSHLLAELDNNTPGPSRTFHSDFHKLFPIFSFTLAVVFLLIMRLHKSKCWKAFHSIAPFTYLLTYLLLTVTFGLGPSFLWLPSIFILYFIVVFMLGTALWRKIFKEKKKSLTPQW